MMDRPDIKRVIIWGYPLDTHTHSYIHASFAKAFSHLGYETYWMSDDDHDRDVCNMPGTLFLSAGEQEQNIPLRDDCFYVLHNVNGEKYVKAGCKMLFIQTHTTQSTANLSEENGDVIISPYAKLRRGTVDCLSMCWGTDLLPHEIDVDNATNVTSGDRYCLWVGTYGDHHTTFQNGTALTPFFEEAKKNNVRLNLIDPWSNPVSFEENMKLVRNAYQAPALQGPWQVANEYIPCRIFKNISYGHYAVTNSQAVSKIFDFQITHRQDTAELFHAAVEDKHRPDHLDRLRFLMEEVRDKHTYVNRIEDILKYLPE